MPLVGKPAGADDDDSENVELVEVRLKATPEVHTAVLFKWAQAGFRVKSDRLNVINVISKTYGLKEYVAYGLLSGDILHTVDGEDILFAFPDGWYRTEKKETDDRQQS